MDNENWCFGVKFTTIYFHDVPGLISVRHNTT